MSIGLISTSDISAVSQLKRGEQQLSFSQVPRVVLGGLPIAVLGRDETAKLIVNSGLARRRGDRPWIFTSANGEVISRVASNRAIAELFGEADLISADGQFLVFVSRWFCSNALPMRVCTTDLFTMRLGTRCEGAPLSTYLELWKRKTEELSSAFAKSTPICTLLVARTAISQATR